MSGTDTRPTILIVRHGRTALNAQALLRGRIDEPLDETGSAEAEALGSALAGERLIWVVSSPLRRAADTARAVASAHPGLGVHLDADLLDRDWGPWAGRPMEDLLARYGDADRAPDVEARPDFVRRVMAAFDRSAARAVAGGASVALVGHDAVNRAILTAVAGGEPPGGWSQRTGCWNRLQRTPEGGWAPAVVDRKPVAS